MLLVKAHNTVPQLSLSYPYLHIHTSYLSSWHYDICVLLLPRYIEHLNVYCDSVSNNLMMFAAKMVPELHSRGKYEANTFVICKESRFGESPIPEVQLL